MRQRTGQQRARSAVLLAAQGRDRHRMGGAELGVLCSDWAQRARRHGRGIVPRRP